MTAFPWLVATNMIQRGCQLSVAERVIVALSMRPPAEAAVLWLRMRGDTYREIGWFLGISKDTAWRIIEGPIRQSVYSIIERATLVPETAMVS